MKESWKTESAFGSLDDFYDALLQHGRGVPIKGYCYNALGERQEKTVCYARADAESHHVVCTFKNIHCEINLLPATVRTQLAYALKRAS